VLGAMNQGRNTDTAISAPPVIVVAAPAPTLFFWTRGGL
jgi:hypothetical protein